MTKISGGCLCGALQYSSSAEPVVTAICHCTHCQRQSGAAFSVNVGLPKDALTFTKGTPKVFNDMGSSGLPVYRHFCGDCGSPIYSGVAAMPDLVFLKAGTLNDSNWVKPAFAVWCQSAQPWVPRPEGVPHFAQNPPSA
jgi:hypothetical protein